MTTLAHPIKLKIKNLHVRTICGVFEWEQKKPRDLVVNITYDVSAEQSMASDNIDDTVSYHPICEGIIAKVENTTYQLIEKMAADIMEIVMKDTRVLGATVCIDKPSALPAAESASIEITQTR